MNRKPTENDKVKSLSLNRLHQYRHAQGQNQSEFWGRFGVTQSGVLDTKTAATCPNPRSCCLRSVTSAGSTMRTSLRRASTSSAARARAPSFRAFAAGHTADG